MTERVYVVVKSCVETGCSVFRGVFFTEEAATHFVHSKQARELYRIEEYVPKEDGSAREIY